MKSIICSPALLDEGMLEKKHDIRRFLMSYENNVVYFYVSFTELDSII